MKFHQENNQARLKAEKGDWRNQQIEQQFSSREPNNNSANGSSLLCLAQHTCFHFCRELPLCCRCKSKAALALMFCFQASFHSTERHGFLE